jgi:hypothetical protein
MTRSSVDRLVDVRSNRWSSVIHALSKVSCEDSQGSDDDPYDPMEFIDEDDEF